MADVIKEYVERSREEQRQLFGEIGLKEDCVHFHVTATKRKCCHLCTEVYRQGGRLLCQHEVCYFYKPNQGGKDNGQG